MSIATEISRLQTAKADIKTAIEAKGVTVPSNAKLDTYDDYINQISTGSPFNQTIKKVVVDSNIGTKRDEENVGTITRLADNKYKNNTSVVSLLIPDTVTIIGKYCFQSCSSIKYINLENVEQLLDNAFVYASNLSINVNCPKLINMVGFTFRETNVLSVENLGTIDNIPNSCFLKCYKLYSVVIPQTVTKINSYAFQYDTGLREVNLPSGLTLIGDNAFYQVPAPMILNCPNLTTLGASAFRSSGITTASDLGSIATIANTAFQESKLATVTIPSTVTSIGTYAFYRCRSLTNLTIPNTVTSIGTAGFQECTGLQTLSVSTGLTSLGQAALQQIPCAFTLNCPNLTSLQQGACYMSGITSIINLGSITSIPNNFCYRSYSLTSVVLPSTLTSVGTTAFQECTSLTSINLPTTITTINQAAFYKCPISVIVNLPNLTSLGTQTFAYSAITKVTSLGNITSLPNNTFNYCGSLTEITIPSTVTSIGTNAFSRCSSLQTITCLATTPPTLSSGNFTGDNSLTAIYVPSASVATYQSASGWTSYASKISAIP